MSCRNAQSIRAAFLSTWALMVTACGAGDGEPSPKGLLGSGGREVSGALNWGGSVNLAAGATGRAGEATAEIVGGNGTGPSVIPSVLGAGGPNATASAGAAHATTFVEVAGGPSSHGAGGEVTGGTTSHGADGAVAGSTSSHGAGGAVAGGTSSHTSIAVALGGQIGGGGVAATSAGVAGASLATGLAVLAGAAGAGAFLAAGATFAAAGSSLIQRLPQIAAEAIPTVETASFAPSGSTTDIADDSAIFANPSSPELSVVVADNKDNANGGVGVFDMQGNLLQFRQDGMIGNIDLRAGFPFNGSSIVLVGANNRTDNTLIFWELDPSARRLSAPIGTSTVTIAPNYGSCLYHSVKTGKFYAFVTQLTGTSTMQQYELDSTGGKVTAVLVRSFAVGSISEGCVADDELGWLYVAQEDVALWRYGAEPNDGNVRSQVGAVGDGHLAADLEGVAIAKGSGTTGYLVVSVQGESRFAIYDRETNAYLSGFTVGSNGPIDVVSQTDGLDISTANLGPGFENGAMVLHDGDNADGNTSNLKYVPLQR